MVKFKAGDKVVRLRFYNAKYSAGKVYTIHSVTGVHSLRIQGDNGDWANCHPDNWAHHESNLEGEINMTQAYPPVGFEPKPVPNSKAAYYEELATQHRKIEEDAAISQALRDRIDSDRALASATSILLNGIEAVLLRGLNASNETVWAERRKELQPLAESYGCRIVLVGDKTKATLVRI